MGRYRITSGKFNSQGLCRPFGDHIVWGCYPGARHASLTSTPGYCVTRLRRF